MRGKIGHHKIGACAEIGQNRIRGGWGVKKHKKRRTSFKYVRSLRLNFENVTERFSREYLSLNQNLPVQMWMNQILLWIC